MNVVILIQGREAIPVRAIPLLTNWRFMSPDIVAHVLGGTGGSNVSVFGDLQAHALVGGRLKTVPKDWWVQNPLLELNALSKKIKAAEQIDEVGYSAWKKQSLNELPAGMFVWKDDYQVLHDKNWNDRYSIAYCALKNWNGEQSDEDVESQMPRDLQRDLVDETPLQRQLRESLEVLKRWREPDYSPFMSEDQQYLVMAGFEHLLSGTAPALDIATLAVTGPIKPQCIPRSERPDLLSPLIESAQREAQDPFNANEIWPKLCDKAEKKIRPFVGSSDGELKWANGDDDVQFLTLKMLRDRLGRQKNKLRKQR